MTPPPGAREGARGEGAGHRPGGVDRRDYGTSPGMCRRRGSGSGMPCVAGASLEVCERRVAFPHYVHASASKRRHDGLIYAPGGEDVMWRFIHHLAASRQIHRTESRHRGGAGGFSFDFSAPSVMDSEGLFDFCISFLRLSFSFYGRDLFVDWSRPWTCQ